MTDEPSTTTMTLLGLRRGGPPTDVSAPLQKLWEYQRDQSPVFDHCLPSPQGERYVHSNNAPHARVAVDASALNETVLSSCSNGAQQHHYYHHSYTPITEDPTPRSRAQQGKHHHHHQQQQQQNRSATMPTNGNSRTMHEDAEGLVSAKERVRYRSDVTRKLLDLYEELTEMQDCSGNMERQLRDAMRADPRYAKENRGVVRLAAQPSPVQEAALSALAAAVGVAHLACVEMVAAFLTPEEKRFLGLNTHVFQTHQERTTTYQYVSESTRRKATRGSSPSKSSCAPAAKSRGTQYSDSSRPLRADDDAHVVSSPPQVHVAAAASSPPASASSTTTGGSRTKQSKHASVASSVKKPSALSSSSPSAAAAAAPVSHSLPPSAVSIKKTPVVSDVPHDTNSSVAEGTPERYAPSTEMARNASASTLGDVVAVSSGAPTPTRPKPSLDGSASSLHKQQPRSTPLQAPPSAAAAAAVPVLNNSAVANSEKGVKPTAAPVKSRFQQFVIETDTDSAM